MNRIKDQLYFWYSYLQRVLAQRGESIKFFNWIGDSENAYWFKMFIEDRKMQKSEKDSISFFSVFGNTLPILVNRSKLKVFFSGEDIHDRFLRYRNYALNHNIDLALGFDYMDTDKYMRFPLWILYFINPKSTRTDIETFCATLSNHSRIEPIPGFCSMVYSHDPNGLRKEMYDALASIGEVSSGGRFLNNTDELKIKYNDDKLRYLSQFKFTICPENSNSRGYVTEKIVEAIYSGTIPIYWGAENNPEPDILNQDAIIFWNKGGNNSSVIRQIKEFQTNQRLYAEFYQQPRLLPHASEAIMERLENLENRLIVLFKNSVGSTS
jgi:hypothetical protein